MSLGDFLARVLLDEIECDSAQGGEVLGGVFRAGAAFVFAERDVERPMQGVLDAPMFAHGRAESPGIQGQAREVIAALDGVLSLDAPDGFDHAHAAQLFPLLLVFEPIDIGGLPVATGFDSSMVWKESMAPGATVGAGWVAQGRTASVKNSSISS